MPSALDNLGQHLLGRVPSEPDPRNWPLSYFMRPGLQAALPGLGTGVNAVDVALAALDKSHEGRATKAVIHAIVSEMRGVVPQPTPTPSPAPTPTPPPEPPPAPSPPPVPQAVVWADSEQLDQGQTGHCVGFGWCQWGNTSPIDDHYMNLDGDAVYYEAKTIDGEPGAENGSSVHSGAKAMKARGRIAAYAWATSVDEIKAWVLGYGPVVMGTDWYDSMFEPDAEGLVTIGGNIAGGHCYACDGYDPATDRFTFQNSWGSNWGHPAGRFHMSAADLGRLMADQGEACTGIELG